MSVIKLFAALATIAFLATPASAAPAKSCPSGMSYCAKGGWGSGGCYKPGYASCTNGKVCSSGVRACGPGTGGNGGCYKPGYASCTNGMVCSSGMRPVCPAARAGAVATSLAMRGASRVRSSTREPLHKV